MYVTNEWFIFHEAIDKKTCNKIKRLAQGNWVGASIDIKTTTLDEERKTEIIVYIFSLASVIPL